MLDRDFVGFSRYLQFDMLILFLFMVSDQSLNIAIAEDDYFSRTLLYATISKMEKVKLEIVATNGIDLLNQLSLKSIDLILLDLYMPIMDGWEVLEHLPQTYYSGKVICMSNGYYKNYPEKLKGFAVDCYIPKENNIIKQCIQQIQSNVPLNIHHSNFPLYFHKHESSSIQYSFKSIELQIIQYLANGLSYLEISNQKGLEHLSDRSIETYVLKMIKSLHLKSRGHLISYAYAHGLIHSFDFTPPPQL